MENYRSGDKPPFSVNNEEKRKKEQRAQELLSEFRTRHHEEMSSVLKEGAAAENGGGGGGNTSSWLQSPAAHEKINRGRQILVERKNTPRSATAPVVNSSSPSKTNTNISVCSNIPPLPFVPSATQTPQRDSTTTTPRDREGQSSSSATTPNARQNKQLQHAEVALSEKISKLEKRIVELVNENGQLLELADKKVITSGEEEEKRQKGLATAFSNLQTENKNLIEKVEKMNHEIVNLQSSHAKQKQKDEASKDSLLAEEKRLREKQQLDYEKELQRLFQQQLSVEEQQHLHAEELEKNENQHAKEIQELKTENARATQNIQQLTNQLHDMKENAKLTHNADTNRSSEMIAKLQTDVRTAEAKQFDAAEKIEKIQREATQQQETNSKLIGQHVDRIAQLEKEKNRFEEQVSSQKISFEEKWQTKVQEYELKIKNLNSEHSAEMQELQENSNRNKQENERVLQQKVNELEKQQEAWSHQLESEKASHKAATLQLQSSLDRLVAQSQQCEKQHEETKKALETKFQEAQNYATQNETAQLQQIQDLEDQLSVCQKEKQSMTDAQRQQYTASLEKQKLDSNNSAQGQIQLHVERVKTLEQEVKDAQYENQKLQSGHSVTIARLESQLQEERNNLRQYRVEQNAKVQDLMRQAESEREAFQLEKSEDLKKISQLQRETQEGKDGSWQHQSQQEQKMKDVQNALQIAERDCEQLKQHLRSEREACDHSTKELKEVREKLEQVETHAQSWQHKVEVLEQENAALVNRMETRSRSGQGAVLQEYDMSAASETSEGQQLRFEQIQQQAERLEQLEHQVISLSEHCEGLKKERVKILAEFSEVQSRCEAKQSLVRKMEGDIQTLRSQLSTVKQEGYVKSANSANLHQDLTDAEKTIINLNNLLTQSRETSHQWVEAHYISAGAMSFFQEYCEKMIHHLSEDYMTPLMVNRQKYILALQLERAQYQKNFDSKFVDITDENQRQGELVTALQQQLSEVELDRDSLLDLVREHEESTGQLIQAQSLDMLEQEQNARRLQIELDYYKAGLLREVCQAWHRMTLEGIRYFTQSQELANHCHHQQEQVQQLKEQKRSALAELEGRWKESEEANNRLSTELREAQQVAQEESRQATDAKRHAENAVHKSNEENIAMREELEAATHSKAKLQQEVQTWRKKYEEHETDWGKQQDKFDNINKEMQKYKKKCEKYETEHNDVESSHQEELHKIQNETQKFKNEITTLTMQLESNANNGKRFQEECLALTEKAEKYQKIVAEKEKEMELQNANFATEKRRFEDQLHSVEKEKGQLELNFQKVKNESELLRSEHEEKKEKLHVAEKNALKYCSDFETTLRGMETYKTEVANIKNENSELLQWNNDQKKQIHDLKNDILKMREENANLTQDVRHRDHQIQMQTEELENLQREHQSEYQRLRDKYHHVCEKQDKQDQEQIEKYEKLQKELREAREAHSTLQNSIFLQKIEWHNTQNNFKELEHSHERLNADYKDAQKKVEQLHQQLESKVNDMHLQARAHEQELSNIRVRVLEDSQASLSQVEKLLHAERIAAQEAYASQKAAMKFVDQLQKENSKLEEKYRSLEAEAQTSAVELEERRREFSTLMVIAEDTCRQIGIEEPSSVSPSELILNLHRRVTLQQASVDECFIEQVQCDDLIASLEKHTTLVNSETVVVHRVHASLRRAMETLKRRKPNKEDATRYSIYKIQKAAFAHLEEQNIAVEKCMRGAAEFNASVRAQADILLRHLKNLETALSTPARPGLHILESLSQQKVYVAMKAQTLLAPVSKQLQVLKDIREAYGTWESTFEYSTHQLMQNLAASATLTNFPTKSTAEIPIPSIIDNLDEKMSVFAEGEDFAKKKFVISLEELEDEMKLYRGGQPPPPGGKASAVSVSNRRGGQPLITNHHNISSNNAYNRVTDSTTAIIQRRTLIASQSRRQSEAEEKRHEKLQKIRHDREQQSSKQDAGINKKKKSGDLDLEEDEEEEEIREDTEEGTNSELSEEEEQTQLQTPKFETGTDYHRQYIKLHKENRRLYRLVRSLTEKLKSEGQQRQTGRRQNHAQTTAAQNNQFTSSHEADTSTAASEHGGVDEFPSPIPVVPPSGAAFELHLNSERHEGPALHSARGGDSQPSTSRHPQQQNLSAASGHHPEAIEVTNDLDDERNSSVEPSPPNPADVVWVPREYFRESVDDPDRDSD